MVRGRGRRCGRERREHLGRWGLFERCSRFGEAGEPKGNQQSTFAHTHTSSSHSTTLTWSPNPYPHCDSTAAVSFAARRLRPAARAICLAARGQRRAVRAEHPASSMVDHAVMAVDDGNANGEAPVAHAVKVWTRCRTIHRIRDAASLAGFRQTPTSSPISIFGWRPRLWRCTWRTRCETK